MQFNAIKMAHAPPGHHSVMGRPSAGGLNFPEYVVYRGEQVRICIKTKSTCIRFNVPRCNFYFQAYPEYLITYQIVKPNENTEAR